MSEREPAPQDHVRRHDPVFTAIERGADGRVRYAAGLIDLSGCIAQGSTGLEARERLEAISPAYFEQLAKLKVPIPDPTAVPSVIPGPVAFYDPITGISVTASLSEFAGPQRMMVP